MDSLVINEMQKAMEKDCDESSHPISFPVVTQTDIRRIFDPISYSKGASIIRMMKSFLGEEAFQSGMTEYLKKFEYSNAVHDDLWHIMTNKGYEYKTLPKHMTVKEIMDTWTLQSGFPTINVTRHDNDLILKQLKFNFPISNYNDKTKWFIPITFATELEPDSSEIPMHWMSNKDESITIHDIVTPNKWLYLNVNRTAYYRVNYDYTSWSYLSRNYSQLPDVIRAKIVDDSLNLARAQLTGYDIPITFLWRMGTTANDYLSWSAAFNGIEFLTSMLVRDKAYEPFKALMRFIGRQEYDRVGFESKLDDSHMELIHRSRIIKHACFFGYDRCTMEAQLIYRKWMTDPNKNQ